jgi:hypothetical protein
MILTLTRIAIGFAGFLFLVSANPFFKKSLIAPT